MRPNLTIVMFIVAAIFIPVEYIVVTCVFSPRLPEIIDSHFDEKGEANGQSSKNSYFSLMNILGILIYYLLPACSLLVLCCPADLINLPNKEFLLSPMMRHRTAGVLLSFFTEFGFVASEFILIIFVLGIVQNLISKKYNIIVYAVSIGLPIFLIYVVIWVIRMIYKIYHLKDTIVQQPVTQVHHPETINNANTTLYQQQSLAEDKD
ncbi:uncharacterized protein MONOS_5583 [Monocercomonoides exilis]|uniref:uncharacterized protein n=1 Tax=Monocercomonoides exilis TaxID=2049356 RepID=UPI0035595070|nr:hypothetical protein MONOS_5583 [Monocercomonoides exilis]|eukprot:MONOS_5583.1-p1 / transcript=MONOS_5583.1 / gene=MONOS_5583 / organism=Monocercomonoides_exilis_PA203 / gene_product=unspecified product / transcript_product=unspecified product / location=Mono_scaffold00164:68420-69202(+) / protein_length=207 / sequence_SO=supercontig / SO=protein_coding / is_pseudo=false